VRERYGAEATPFKLGVDSDEYSPLGTPRRNDTIAFYARTFTERRGVELGLLALEEVKRQRPNTRIALYGSHAMVHVPFTYQPGAAATALQRGDRRPQPLADELLADPAGDDGLRPARR
jgi:hypothetical protein